MRWLHARLHQLASSLRLLLAAGETDDDFCADPLRHPALQSMSQAELADLPLSIGIGRPQCRS